MKYLRNIGRLSFKQQLATNRFDRTIFDQAKTKTEARAVAVEIRIKEFVFTRTLMLQFYLLNPLDKSPKEAELVNGSYVMGFMLFSLKLQE